MSDLVFFFPLNMSLRLALTVFDYCFYAIIGVPKLRHD